MKIFLLTFFILEIFTLILAEDKCGQHECDNQTFNQSYHFYLQGCFCDSRCVVYGDCCAKYQPTDISTASTNYGQAKCVKIAGQNRSLMMITSCSRDYQHASEISQNCDIDTGHPASGVPVTGIETKIVYKNMFCAVCNGESNYTFWNVRIECSEKIDLRNLSKTFGSQMNGCLKQMDNLDASYEHKCSGSIISNCSQDTRDEQTVRNCLDGHYGVVYDTKGNMYRNIYCFNCHINKSEDLRCQSTDEPMKPYRQDLSFVVLINFNRHRIQSTGHKLVLLDPCKDGYTYNDGHCHQELQKVKTQNCDQVELKSHEYIFLANGTLYHNSTQTFHGKEYYSLGNRSHVNVYICKNRIYMTGSKIEAHLTYVCSIISMIALAILIAKFLYFRNILKLSGFIYVSFAVALFLAQLLFLLTPQFSNNGFSSCHSVAVAMHYTFLASFFWLNSITINIWLSVCWTPCQTKKSSEKCSFISYSVYSWLAPMILVLPAILIDKYRPNSIFAPSYGINELCWINNGWSIMLFFAGPLAFIILVNIILYIQTAVTIYKLRKFTQQHSDRNDSVAIFINLKLCLLTGITWIIGYIAVVTRSYSVRIAFIFLNSSFGLWVAISFLLTRNIFSKLRQKIKTITETAE